ncbi:MAG: hypothetical protein AB8F65_09170 [Woeseiaceae bacterium]
MRLKHAVTSVASKQLKLPSLWFAMVLIAGCASVEKTEAPPAAELELPTALADRQPSSLARKFTIIPDESEVRILTFRDGPMARLGHNHVISSRTLSGNVWLEPTLGNSLTDISLPVASFSVDDPALRSEEGEGFETPLPESARSGTRENMLSDAVLNAASFAFIRARCGDIRTEAPASIRCIFSVAGNTSTLDLPIELELDETRLTASGEVAIGHEQLGLSAFSAGGGAIRVAEQITVRFKISAQQLSR